MTFEALLGLAAAVFVFSLKLGPGIMMAMSRAVSDGVSGLLTFFVGFNIGLAIYLSVVFIGLDVIQIDMVFLTILVKSLAATYLIYIGIKGLQNNKVAVREEEAQVQGFLDNVTSAMMLTLSNPMVIVFYASIIPVFIAPEAVNVQVSLVVMALIMIIDTMGMVIYCAPLLLFRKTISESFMKKVSMLSSIVMILIGLYIGYTAVGAADILSVF